MLKNSLAALVLTVCLVFFAAPAGATGVGADGCDEALFGEMKNSAQTGFDEMDRVVGQLMRAPNSAQNYDCARDQFNIWDSGNLGGVGGLLASALSSVMSMFGISSLGGGITLTESAGGWSIIIKIINTFFNTFGQFNELICTDMWDDTLGYAMAPVDFGGGSAGVFTFTLPNTPVTFESVNSLGGLVGALTGTVQYTFGGVKFP
jgi:hypothetical protein